MIHHCSGDIFESQADCLVNPVNCIGVSGAGLAKEFKLRFPESYERYRARCAAGQMRPGWVFWDDVIDEKTWPVVAYFPSKVHWRMKSNIADIVAGLRHLRQMVDLAAIPSIAIPALGCGLGELDWEIVKPMIEAAFADCAAQVYLYAPQEKPNVNRHPRSARPARSGQYDPARGSRDTDLPRKLGAK